MVTNIFFILVLRRTNTKILRISSFTDGGRPLVPLHALFQVQTGTLVEPPTFPKLAG